MLSVVLVLLFCALLPARAEAAAGMQSCAEISDDQRRLACYDALSARATESTNAARSTPPDGLNTARKTAREPITAPRAAASGAEVPPPTAAPSPPSDSMIERAWSFNPDSERYLIKLYGPNYLNPVRYQSRTNDQPFTPLFQASDAPDSDLDKVEAAFQISFKSRVWATKDRRFGFWFAYTQASFWQVYNGEISSPFRDTNYMPELMVTWQPRLSFGGFDWNLLGLGYTHESNGRADPISRSWDRLIAQIGLEKDNFALLIRPWIRIDDSSADKDNPDITDYYGYGDITAVYKWRGHSFTLMARGNPAEAKGAVRVSWMTPRILGPLRGYLVGFSGYGDSLIDYNFKQNAISIGVALNDVLDR
jgi:phospholipase A1